MTQKLDKLVLENGMTIIAEQVANVASAAFAIHLPCGAATLPTGCCGASSVISDWLFRGAGPLDSRQLADALDGLGLQRNDSANSAHLKIGAALEAGNLENALNLYADIVLQPMLDPAQFEHARQLAVHEIVGLDDEPHHKVMTMLYEQFYPDPFGRPSLGRLEDLQALNCQKTARIIKDNFNLSQTVLAVAGKYDFDKLCRQVEKLFSVPQPVPVQTPNPVAKGRPYTHYENKGAQVHIGLMTPVPPAANPDYYNIAVAVSILSGSMSSRLFTEVREKRGLCYAVSAQYSTLKDLAGISCYAGTTPDNAQETIDLIIAEFRRLGKGVTEDELGRSKIGLKSSLIMHSESTSARASAIAGDHYLLGSVRSIDQISQKLDNVSVDSVMAFLANNRFDDFTVVTVGPKAVNIQG